MRVSLTFAKIPLVPHDDCTVVQCLCLINPLCRPLLLCRPLCRPLWFRFRAWDSSSVFFDAVLNAVRFRVPTTGRCFLLGTSMIGLSGTTRPAAAPVVLGYCMGILLGIIVE